MPCSSRPPTRSGMAIPLHQAPRQAPRRGTRAIPRRRGIDVRLGRADRRGKLPRPSPDGSAGDHARIAGSICSGLRLRPRGLPRLRARAGHDSRLCPLAPSPGRCSKASTRLSRWRSGLSTWFSTPSVCPAPRRTRSRGRGRSEWPSPGWGSRSAVSSRPSWDTMRRPVGLLVLHPGLSSTIGDRQLALPSLEFGVPRRWRGAMRPVVRWRRRMSCLPTTWTMPPIELTLSAGERSMKHVRALAPGGSPAATDRRSAREGERPIPARGPPKLRCEARRRAHPAGQECEAGFARISRCEADGGRRRSSAAVRTKPDSSRAS